MLTRPMPALLNCGTGTMNFNNPEFNIRFDYKLPDSLLIQQSLKIKDNIWFWTPLDYWNPAF